MEPGSDPANIPALTSVEELQRALTYYQQLVNELGGANVQADAIISSVKSDLRVKNDGFDLLAELQESIDAHMPIEEMIYKTLESINLRLHMDRSVFLARTPNGLGFMPRYGLGFDTPTLSRFPAIVLDFATCLANKGSYLLVNKSVASTPLIEQLREQLGVPFFIALPVVVGREMTGVLLAGRYKEIKPFAPPVSPSGVNIMRAIAGFISVSWANANQYIILEQQVQERTGELQRSLEELHATQQELVRQEKLASVGQLTKGIVDRILNPLNYVSNFSQSSDEVIGDVMSLLQKQQDVLPAATLDTLLDDVQALQDNSVKIQEHSTSTTRILKDMQKLLKVKSQDLVDTDLNQFVETKARAALQELSAEYKSFAIQMIFAPAPQPVPISLLPFELGQVVHSLVSNACYTLFEKSKSAKEFAPELRISIRLDAGQAVVRVRDNGKGIAAREVPKLFTPFFTTKPTSKGTGLGLFMAKDIVEIHQGAISIDTQEGQFTEVTLTLPTLNG